MGNRNMHRARTNANDEFYTLVSDIENELKNYREHFEGKHIFMNADDPKESNFWFYFYNNFDFLGLKKITSTHYDDTNSTYRLDYDGGKTIKTPLKQNGDFRSPESVEILKEADIVVTNPPFSLFREYIAQLIKYDKKFIVIGNMNAVTYKEIFPLIKDNKIWLGVNNGTMEFQIPENAPKKTAQRTDNEGIRYQKFGNINWFTNLEHNRRKERLRLGKNYTPEDYPEYDNYNAINVDRVSNIPEDYTSAMGVPITFLTRHNPEQFELIGSDFEVEEKLPELIKNDWEGKLDRGYVENKRKYSRILIQKTQEGED